MKLRHLILLILMNFLWAGTYSAFKVLEPQLDAGGVVTFRFAIAALGALLLWPLFKGKVPRGTDLLKTIVMGVVVFSIGPRLQVEGVQRGSAGDSSVLVALEPLIASIGAAIFLREHITMRRWFGFLLGLVGVLFLARIWRPDFKLPGLFANALFVSSFICETVYSIMGKPLIERAGLMKVVAIGLFAGTVVNLAVDGQKVFMAVPTLPPGSWVLLLYLGLACTLLGYGVWFAVIQETPVNVTAMTIFVQPVVGLLMATLLLKEKFHWGHLWGSLAIVAGLVVGLSGKAEQQKT